MPPRDPIEAGSNPPAPTDLWVICLCAQWCHICRDMRVAVDRDRRLHRLVNWRWVDVEDDADLLGNLEVETFPTYLIGHRDQVLLFAPGPTRVDALLAMVTPYATGRVQATAVPEVVSHALTALTLKARA